MRMSIGLVLGTSLICGTGAAATTDTPETPLSIAEIEQQIAQIDARLRNPELSDLERYDLALRKARLRRQFQRPLIGSKGPADPAPTSQAVLREEGLPSAIGYFTQVISQYERQLSRQPPGLTDAQQKAWAQQTAKLTDTNLRSMYGKRLWVTGTVADVQAKDEGYAVTLTYPAGPRRLTNKEQDRLAKLRDSIILHKRFAELIRERGPGMLTVTGTGIPFDREEVAQIHAASRERIPKHQITITTSDPKALELRRGWGLSTAITVTSARLQSVQFDEVRQYYIEMAATAETLGLATAPAPAPATAPATTPADDPDPDSISPSADESAKAP